LLGILTGIDNSKIQVKAVVVAGIDLGQAEREAVASGERKQS